MPYSSNRDLPESVRNALPVEAQSLWRKIFNGAYKQNEDDSAAAAIAWSGLKMAGCKRGQDGEWVKTEKRAFQVFKVQKPEQLVFGWASVAFTTDGELITDLQADQIDVPAFEKVVYDFVLEFRDTGVLHEGKSVGKLVESIYFTQEKMEHMGIPEGIVPEGGWWIGFKISDEAVFNRVVSGELKMFSIQGEGIREEVVA